MPRLVGVGDNTVDTYVDAGMQYPGGNAVNVAVLARRLGAETGYLGCLGKDEAGALLFEALSAEGVDLARCRRLEGANARARIAHESGDRRFIGSQRGVRGAYGWTDADFAYLGGFDLGHTSIYSELEDVLPRLKGALPRVSFDYSERWTPDYLARTLPFVDIAFLSHPRGTDADCAALLRTCCGLGPRIAVATRGRAGALAIEGNEILAQPIVETELVDTLGAGDGFIAAFLVAHLQGAPTSEALARGAAFAARVCTWRGAFGHGRPWREPLSAQNEQRS
jgi:fructoselysine 6-kinase